MFEREFNFHPGHEDIVTESVELRHGRAAFLFAKGRRPKQGDALWAGIKDGVLYTCASDGVGSIEGSELTAQKITEFGRAAFIDQIQRDTINLMAIQEQIDAALYAWQPYHKGRATSLCMVIGDTIQGSRIGDPVTWRDGQIYPHLNWLPEVDDFREIRTWWAAHPHATKVQLKKQLARTRINRSGLLCGSLGYREFPEEPNVNASAEPGKIELPEKHFVGGSDGLNPYRFSDVFDALDGDDPRVFLLELLKEINTIGRDNASGLAFFRHQARLE